MKSMLINTTMIIMQSVCIHYGHPICIIDITVDITKYIVFKSTIKIII